MAHGDKSKAILAYLSEHPEVANREVARRLGCSRQLVAMVRDANDIPGATRGNKPAVHVCLPREQLQWLQATRPANVSMSAHIASIITDAMWEDQQ